MGSALITGIVAIFVGGTVATVAAVSIVTAQTNAGTSIEKSSSSTSSAAYNSK